MLHEMTHWGDWIADGAYQPHETGNAFEREAYGFRPVRWDYQIVDYPAHLQWRAPRT